MFDIYLTDDVVSESEHEQQGNLFVLGSIQIGDFRETLRVSLLSWNRLQYEQHWEEALRRLVGGADQSVLITSFVRPGLANCLEWWPLYREKDVVRIQNQWLFYDQRDVDFSEQNPWDLVRPLQTRNAEGFEISEWTTSLESIRDCLTRKFPSG